MKPTWPVRADHRLIYKIANMILKDGKVEPHPEEFDLVSRVFSQAGGSWVRLFRGSPEDINLLKQTIKVAFKRKRLTRKWEP